MPPKKVTSFALSEEALRLLTVLASHLGLARTGVLEVLIRDRAERERVKSTDPLPR